MKNRVSPKEENFAYVKFENEEALSSKKDLLSAQILLLNALKIEKNYRNYRMQELEAKRTLIKKMKGLKANLSLLQKSLPKVKMPKNLDRSSSESTFSSKVNDAKGDRSIEDQLYEIQRRLNELQSRNP